VCSEAEDFNHVWRVRRCVQVGTAALTGTIALSAYAGVVGLVGGARSYSWFHPTWLGLAILVLMSGWLLEQTGRFSSKSTANRHAEPQLRT
jgi:hypothetical protein